MHSSGRPEPHLVDQNRAITVPGFDPGTVWSTRPVPGSLMALEWGLTGRPDPTLVDQTALGWGFWACVGFCSFKTLIK